MIPRDCPKFHKCNAPICPLDKDWMIRAFHKNDATCFYLLEFVKEGAKARFYTAKLGDIYEEIISVRDPICERVGRIKDKLQSAKNNKTRMNGNIQENVKNKKKQK